MSLGDWNRVIQDHHDKAAITRAAAAEAAASEPTYRVRDIEETPDTKLLGRKFPSFALAVRSAAAAVLNAGADLDPHTVQGYSTSSRLAAEKLEYVARINSRHLNYATRLVLEFDTPFRRRKLTLRAVTE